MPELPLPDGRLATVITEGHPVPNSLSPIDDAARASDVLARLRAGEGLLYMGDFHNARQLLTALRRRLRQRHTPRGSLAERWRAERARVQRESTVLSGVLVPLEPDGSCPLRRAPDTRQAVRWAWGALERPAVVSLRTLQGALGAAGWTEKGLTLPGLAGRLTPRFGVFSPTRHAYLQLLDDVGFTDKRVLDVGCGTGVLACIALQRGARSAVATDIEPRAVAAAVANAASLGLTGQFEAHVADCWVEGTFDLVLCNPPWLQWEAHTALDRAVFDPGGAFLQRLLTGLPDHLAPGGEAVLLISDLPERLGLRAEGALEEDFVRAGLEVRERTSAPAHHRRSRDRDDPLHAARGAERIVRWRLVPGRAGTPESG